MTEEPIKKARELDCLTEADRKEGLFIIDEYPTPNHRCGVFLDLRNGFNIYGYDSYGDSMEIKRRKIPKEIKELESLVRAEGSMRLSDF